VASTIGIKIANGEFYSIVEENSQVKKRLILTTVHDKQRSVQIDLYKSFTKTMADALYIGSLVVENIKPRSRGEPSIEMIITSTKTGEISAEAIDLDSSPNGEHQYLNVSLESLDEDNRDFEIPDFELEQNESPPSGLYEKAKTIKQDEEKNFPWPIVIIAAALLIALCLGGWFFFIKDGTLSKGAQSTARTAPVQTAPAPRPPAAQPAEPAKPAAVEPAEPAEAAKPAPVEPAKPAEAAKPAPVETPAPPPVIKAPEKAATPPAPASRKNRPAPPVASYKVPTTIPKDGAPYRIRWGDTLWDIADAFYRNPWLYPRIARFNNIRNPDLIISGTTIRVPPKNQ
jgi:outer membrane biosynthesis protein TonB